MTRDEILKKLHTVEFEFIDPESDWKDIGFTEREIWVNSKGYGYLSCDELNGKWEGPGLSQDKWEHIRRKFLAGNLKPGDLKGTPLIEPFELFYAVNNDEEDDDLVYQALHSIFELNPLPNEQEKLYCLQTWDELRFFNTEEMFLKAYERDYCDYTWEELNDETLVEWIDRLF